MHMRYQALPPDGAFTTVDLTASAVSDVLIDYNYQQPSRMSWLIHAPNHTMPLQKKYFVQLWDDAGDTPFSDPTGGAQSSAAPIFEGFIEEIKPGDETNVVTYAAYDPTRRVSADMTLRTLGFYLPSLGAEPLPWPGGIPRMVFNANIESDEDYTYSLKLWEHLGQILRFIFDSHAERLVWLNAGPTPGYPYKSSDLAGLTFIPQEKLVLASDKLRPAIERLLGQWSPSWRMLWYPGSRKWRFGDINQSPELTLTINDLSNGNPYKILMLNLDRSFDDRKPAVKYYGPEKPVETTATLSEGGLEWVDGGVFLQNDIATCCIVPLMDTFKIVDPFLRPMLRKLQQPVEVQVADFDTETRFYPVLLAYYPNNTRAGFAGWREIPKWGYDSPTGIVTVFSDRGVARYNGNPNGGEPNYESPTDVKVIYATLGDPITVRYPTSGYDGTAYTVAGVKDEMVEYQEMLAVDRINNQPVTTAMRIAQFRELARLVHSQRKDIVYTGTAVLDGLIWDLAALNRRINFAGVNGSGGTVTTGLEAIRAPLTSVSFNLSERTTTLQFSSNQMELAGLNMDSEKQRLGIVELRRRDWTTVSFGTNIRPRTISDPAGGFSSMWNVHENWVNVQTGFEYYNPLTGRLG